MLLKVRDRLTTPIPSCSERYMYDLHGRAIFLIVTVLLTTTEHILIPVLLAFEQSRYYRHRSIFFRANPSGTGALRVA